MKMKHALHLSCSEEEMAEMVSLEGMDVMEHLVLKDLKDLKVNQVH